MGDTITTNYRYSWSSARFDICSDHERACVSGACRACVARISIVFHIFMHARTARTTHARTLMVTQISKRAESSTVPTDTDTRYTEYWMGDT